MRPKELISLAVSILAVSTIQPATAAQQSLVISPDITLNLSSQVVSDESAARDNLQGIILTEPLGMIPTNADLTVFHQCVNGDVLLAFDVTVTLPGNIVAHPADVVRKSGNSYSIEFDGSARGLPSGVHVDAASEYAGSKLMVSFDSTASISGLTFADEDVALVDGAGLVMLFDGSAAGLHPGVDLDALHYNQATNQFYFSFDISGTSGGVSFSDEDLLIYNDTGNTWEMAYDGSAQHPAWQPGDLDATFVYQLGGYLFRDGFETLESAE